MENLAASLAEIERMVMNLEIPMHTRGDKICKKRTGESVTLGVVRERMGNIKISEFTKAHPELTRAIAQFGIAHLPMGTKFSSIQLNHNFKTEVHVDQANFGPSWIITFGNYGNGGQLWTLEDNLVETYHRFVEFNALLPHATIPWRGTDRFSLIFFTTDFFRLADLSILDLLTSYYSFPLPDQGKLLTPQDTITKEILCSVGKKAFRKFLNGNQPQRDEVHNLIKYECHKKKRATPWEHDLVGRVFYDVSYEDQLFLGSRIAVHSVFYCDEGNSVFAYLYNYDFYHLYRPEIQEDTPFIAVDELIDNASIRWIDPHDAVGLAPSQGILVAITPPVETQKKTFLRSSLSWCSYDTISMENYENLYIC